jgi:hypothetical protein
MTHACVMLHSKYMIHGVRMMPSSVSDLLGSKYRQPPGVDTQSPNMYNQSLAEEHLFYFTISLDDQILAITAKQSTVSARGFPLCASRSLNPDKKNCPHMSCLVNPRAKMMSC